MKPFSVLMSIYKSEKPEYLRESLESILQNTVCPDEIVMVKDGPLTSELEAVLDEYQRKTGLFHFVIHSKNLGLGLALRDGLVECRNELVARMDTDDICCGDRFEKQLSFLNDNPDIAVVGSYMDEFQQDVSHTYSVIILPTDDKAIRRFAKRRNPLKHPTVMFRKTAVIQSGNYRHFLWIEDYDLCIRMLLAGYKMANIPEILVHCRADVKLYGRRGGLKYLKQDLKFQKFMLYSGFIGRKEYVVNCLGRSAVRLMPNALRAWVYRTFLRNSAKTDTMSIGGGHDSRKSTYGGSCTGKKVCVPCLLPEWEACA